VNNLNDEAFYCGDNLFLKCKALLACLSWCWSIQI